MKYFRNYIIKWIKEDHSIHEFPFEYKNECILEEGDEIEIRMSSDVGTDPDDFNAVKFRIISVFQRAGTIKPELLIKKI